MSREGKREEYCWINVRDRPKTYILYGESRELSPNTDEASQVLLSGIMKLPLRMPDVYKRLVKDDRIWSCRG